MDPTEQLTELLEAMITKLPAGVQGLSSDLDQAAELMAAGAIPEAPLIRVFLKTLKGKRAFGLIREAGDVFSDHLSDLDQTVIAQAEIDTGSLTRARKRLDPLLDPTGRRGSEANGLMGRAHKQLFVSAMANHDREAAQRHLDACLLYTSPSPRDA